MSRWFVLQALDPVTDCPVLEARFDVPDLAALHGALGSMTEDDPNLSRSYYLDADGTHAITEAFGVAFDHGGREVMLTRFCAEGVREAPYLVHTGFELALMLDGRKPLAIFWGTDRCEWLNDLMRRFDPFVEEGRFVRRKVTVPMTKSWVAPDGAVVDCSQQVYVALRGEEWRIEAFILLHEVVEKAGWNDALERFEGSLLGYEDWQNDWWIERQRRNRQEAEAALAASRTLIPGLGPSLGRVLAGAPK